MQLNQKQKDKIIELKNIGKKQTEIASILKVSQKTISYWLSSEEKRKEISKKVYEQFKKKPLSERQEIYKRRLPYIRNYQRKKYQNNKDFRLKEIERTKKEVKNDNN